MVLRPTGFVRLVHASDADQAEALLTRLGPDGLGKLGGYLRVPRYRQFLMQLLDPCWANPIKARVRQTKQTKAINEAVNALNHPKAVN
ncbi:hypothetical protein B0H10DRAFT_2303967 [Mycena sp. CBHHK59/15]|nr:hypothetical protein B0H10DRAFT_2303967 [Mycena sp. CBHHK59/15]